MAGRRPLDIGVILFRVGAFLGEMFGFTTIITRIIVVLWSGRMNAWGIWLAWCCSDGSRPRINVLPRSVLGRRKRTMKRWQCWEAPVALRVINNSLVLLASTRERGRCSLLLCFLMFLIFLF